MGHLSHVYKAWKVIVEEHGDIINNKGIGDAPSSEILRSDSIRSEILPQKLERERSHGMATENCEIIISDSNKDIKFLRDHGYTV